MGHAHSRYGKGDDDDEGEGSSGNGNSRPRLVAASRSRLRRAFRSTGSNGQLRQSIKHEQFSGMVRITLVSVRANYTLLSLRRMNFERLLSRCLRSPDYKI